VILAAAILIREAETLNLHLDGFRFLLSSGSNAMVMKSIHGSKDVSKRNGFRFDYFVRRKVNVTAE
jgi:hypothetical protein